MIPRPVLLRLLSLALALLVLATSVGLTSERHRCRLSGRSTVVLRLPGLAPAAEAVASRLPGRPTLPCGQRRRGCCDISHAQHKLNAQSPAASLDKWLPTPPVALPLAVLPVAAWTGLAPEGPQPLAPVLRGATGSSPPGSPRAGRRLLVSEGKLVV